MKVLIPIPHYYPVIGGIETWTKNIAENLVEKAEIFVVTGKIKNYPNQEEQKGVKIWRVSLFSLSNLSVSPFVCILSSLPFIFFKSLYLIKKEKIDILHCQGFLSSLLGFLLSRLTKVSYLTTVQRLESKRNPLKNFIYRQAAVCIAASQAIKRNFKEIDCKNIEVIPNGIDLTRFENLDRQKSRQKIGLNGEFVVMTAARLEKVKGIDYLIEAIKLIEAGPRPINIRLIVIGDGSEKENLEDLVVKLDLKDKVEFLGEIPNKEIPAYLVAADCFCLPSLKEGFGIAILEAQAATIPVVGTKIGGILDLVIDNKTGILVELGNSEVIAQALFKVYSQPEFARNLAQNAKKNLNNYDWQIIALKVFKLYEIYHRYPNLPA